MSERNSEPPISFATLEADVTAIFDSYRPGGSPVVWNAFADTISQAYLPEAERTMAIGPPILRPYYGAALYINDPRNQDLLRSRGVQDIAHAGIQLINTSVPIDSLIVDDETGSLKALPSAILSEERFKRHLGLVDKATGNLFLYNTAGELLPTDTSIFRDYDPNLIVQQQALTDGTAITNLSLIDSWLQASALLASHKEDLGLDIDDDEGVWKPRPELA